MNDGPQPGDLVWLEFAPTVGTEQSGRRPALVISDGAYNIASGRALVAPITSKIRGWPFEAPLPGDAAVLGAVLVDQVRVIDWRARRCKHAGTAPETVLQEARAKLAALAGIA